MKTLTAREVDAVSGAGFSEFVTAVEDGLKEVGHFIHDLVH